MKIILKIIFWITFALFCLYFAGLTTTTILFFLGHIADQNINWYFTISWSDIFLQFIILMSLFGYSYKKKLLSLSIFKSMFFFSIFLAIGVNWAFLRISESGLISINLLDVIEVGWTLVCLIIFYMYVFKSNDIWNDN